MTGTAKATLRIARGQPGASARFDAFEVPYEAGASVLDGLIWARENRDPTLAFRYSCTNANVCKECTMRIDGKTGYACVVRLKPGTTLIEPLENKVLIRDLVTDTLSPKPSRRVSQDLVVFAPRTSNFTSCLR